MDRKDKLMSDYGVKISLDGYDLKTCPDYKLAFNSNWPSLKVVQQGIVDVSTTTSGLAHVCDHNLGYYPYVMVFYCNRGTDSAATQADLYVSKNSLYFNIGAPNTATLAYYIFDWDIETVFKGNVNNIENKEPAPNSFDYGFNAILPNKKPGSEDVRDYSLRSDCLNMLIGQSGIGSATEIVIGTYHTGAGEATITHNFGYAPYFALFVKETIDGTEYYHQQNQQAFEGECKSDSSTVYLEIPGGYPFNYAYIIFKDFLKL